MVKLLKDLPSNIYRFFTFQYWWKSGNCSIWHKLNKWIRVRRAIKNSWVYNKNGLPLICHRADGWLLEHEHADHPNYQFPIWVHMKPNPDYYFWSTFDENGVETKTPMTEEEKKLEQSIEHEYQAFIGVENGLIKTAYECCYGYWNYETGENVLGPDKHTDLWSRDKWKIQEEDLFKIKKWFEARL